MTDSVPPPASGTPDQPQRGVRGWLCYQLRLLFTALQFFTRLPAPRWVGFDAAWLAHIGRYFPAAGIVVAMVCALVYAIASWCLPQTVAVLLSTAAGMYVTGALHEDGFADVCDGFGGGMQAQRVLEIMRDSRIGAFGMLGMALLLATKIACLAALPGAQVVPALLLAHPLSRAYAALVMWRMQYVRAEGRVKPVAQQMTAAEFAVAGLTALLPLLLCGMTGWFSLCSLLLALLLGLAACLFLARLFRRRIGGYTGDCLGAVQQLTEAAIYLGLLAKTAPVLF